MSSPPASVKPETAAAVLLAAALGIGWLGACTGTDLALARAMYAGGAFAARHAWWAETIGHDAMRRLLAALAACFIVPVMLDWVRPRAAWSAELRGQLRVVALAAVLVPLATSLLKHYSASHCPWDLLEFGGTQPYFALFDMVPAGLPMGRCMPAGHASSGLWLVSVAVFFRRRRAASGVALAMLGFGFALGWIQQMRGAHFLSHTLWSMWIACAIAAVLAYARPYLAPNQARTSASGHAASASLDAS